MYCYYVHTWLTSDDCCEGVFVTLYFLRCRGLKLGLGGASHIADDGVTALEAAAACCGTSWRDHLLDGSPLPPRAWQGRPRGPVCFLQTWFVLWRPPRRRVRPRALGHNSTRYPDLLPVRLFFCSCYAWGAAPGGGAAAAAAGAWGVEVYGVCDGVLHAYSDGGGGFDL